MECHEARDRLTERRRTAALDRHLARCEDCAAFDREVRGIGHQIAEAYLAQPPSPGFEERVAARLREREIAVRPRRRGLFAAFLVPALTVLLLFVGWRLFRGAGDKPLAIPPREPKPVATVVPTNPLTENLLYLSVTRPASEDPTLVMLSFAGEESEVLLSGDVEEKIFRSFALGARTADVTVGRRIPGREICQLIETLEKAGFSYHLARIKDGP